MDDYYKFKDGINDIEIANNVSIKVDYKKGTYKITNTLFGYSIKFIHYVIIFQKQMKYLLFLYHIYVIEQND